MAHLVLDPNQNRQLSPKGIFVFRRPTEHGSVESLLCTLHLQDDPLRLDGSVGVLLVRIDDEVERVRVERFLVELLCPPRDDAPELEPVAAAAWIRLDPDLGGVTPGLDDDDDAIQWLESEIDSEVLAIAKNLWHAEQRRRWGACPAVSRVRSAKKPRRRRRGRPGSRHGSRHAAEPRARGR